MTENQEVWLREYNNQRERGRTETKAMLKADVLVKEFSNIQSRCFTAESRVDDVD